MKITTGTEKDLKEWVDARNNLWPIKELQVHELELRELLESDSFFSFLAKDDNNKVVGFLEAFIRPFANGCEKKPVMFLEGIWVDPDQRNKELGRKLLDHLQNTAKERGFLEIGSDCDISNETSQLVHQKWGFKETERVVYYRKSLE